MPHLSAPLTSLQNQSLDGFRELIRNVNDYSRLRDLALLFFKIEIVIGLLVYFWLVLLFLGLFICFVYIIFLCFNWFLSK